MTAEERLAEEVRLLKGRYPDLELRQEGRWVRIPNYPLPPGWNRPTTDVAFQMVGPPTAPYGIYVPTGLLFKGGRPNNYNEAGNVPFPGSWAVFSWQPVDGQWQPSDTVGGGSNYLNWVLGFSTRFREGL